MRALFAAVIGLATIAAACDPTSSAAPPVSSSTAGSPAAPTEDVLASLVPAAQAEGALTTIALPHDRCNFGGIIEGFADTYGLEVTELEPEADAAAQLAALEAGRNDPGSAPDVVDLDLTDGRSAREAGLIEPYEVAIWDTIPDEAKDPDGHWWGAYYGVLTFEVNTTFVSNVPRDWPDLLKPEYQGQVALAGDPRTTSEAIQAVGAASLANGGSLDDVGPGLDFFAELVEAGNLVPRAASAASVASGATPIAIRWSYFALRNRDAMAASGGPEIAVVIPASGRLAGVRVQAINAVAAHPSAARLWGEFLAGDVGQDLFLGGACYPIRYEQLLADGRIPQELQDRMPAAEGAVFPSLDQLNAAGDRVAADWQSVVGMDIR